MPSLAAIARDTHDLIVIQKSAQVGVTELLVNTALWAADTTYAGRGVVLTLMPTQNQMDDFVRERYDRAIQDDAYLRQRLQPEPPRRKGADSMRLKRIGDGHVFFRGADSRRQIASVDADLVILDEYDQMGEGVLELAKRRLASSRAGRILIASTPRLPEAGVNSLYMRSDQRRYFLPCTACQLEQDLSWNLNVDKKRAIIVCRYCRAPMNVLTEGRWIAQAPGNEKIRGYHLSRLYSPWANVPQMIEASEEGSLAGIQEFYNSDLGEPFAPTDGQLTFDVLDRCRDDYSVPASPDRATKTFMGVDVGKLLHVVIREPQDEDSRSTRAVFVGTVPEFRDIEVLAARFNVGVIVVDSQPERRSVIELARQRNGYQVGLARYARSDGGHVRSSEEGVTIYKADRNLAIEEMINRFEMRNSLLPSEARNIGGRIKDGLGEYYRQMTALKRIAEQDVMGNWVYRYEDGGKADHYAHAEVYCELARQWGALGYASGSIDPPAYPGNPLFPREHRQLLSHERRRYWQ